jgi:sortase A
MNKFYKIITYFTLISGVAISLHSSLAIRQSLSIGGGTEFTSSIKAFEASASPQLLASNESTQLLTRSPVNHVNLKVKKGDLIGTLIIPRIKKSIPIYEGTEQDQLKKGAGHHIKSVLPGLADNSVIAGHRDSVFSKFNLLQKGDRILVKTSYGNFTYKIKSFRIVDSDDRTVIVPTKVATLTLSTCYPFYFIGNAPQRFIVTAVLT